ncbi:UNVERIFIED_CONTAM: hypothetical protein HDU68_012072 [Siphonaria sp. JEL0065]|nr:hypothetical protein HDU68_012072 [Siphonaria sp. JEL0065]
MYQKMMPKVAGANSVACLIIGDEVLGGKIQDTNSNFLARLCFETGLSLKRILVVPDEEEDVIESVKELSAKYAHVFTSGGIGPTHDDITYDSISKAFNSSLTLHEPTIRHMERIWNKRFPNEAFVLNGGRIRMATLPIGDPASSVTFPCDDLWVPVVSVNHNVHIFPGVPTIFQQMMTSFIHDTIVPAVPGLKKYIRMEIGTNKWENEVMHVLREWQKKVQGEGVKVGSYPKAFPEKIVDPVSGVERVVNVVVSVVGTDEDGVRETIEGIKRDLE